MFNIIYAGVNDLCWYHRRTSIQGALSGVITGGNIVVEPSLKKKSKETTSMHLNKVSPFKTVSSRDGLIGIDSIMVKI